MAGVVGAAAVAPTGGDGGRRRWRLAQAVPAVVVVAVGVVDNRAAMVGIPQFTANSATQYSKQAAMAASGGGGGGGAGKMRDECMMAADGGSGGGGNGGTGWPLALAANRDWRPMVAMVPPVQPGEMRQCTPLTGLSLNDVLTYS